MNVFWDGLVCPQTHEPLVVLAADRLPALKAKVDQGQLMSLEGVPVAAKLDAVLTRGDGKIGFPVVKGIPILLMSEAFNLENL